MTPTQMAPTGLRVIPRGNDHAPIREDADPRSGGVRCRRLRVLVIEDHPALHEMIVRMLRRVEIDILSAESLLDERDRKKPASVDAILLDLIPSRDGGKSDFATWHSIRPRVVGVPIVFLVDSDDADTPPMLVGNTMTHALRKPFGMKALLNVLFSAIESRLVRH